MDKNITEETDILLNVSILSNITGNVSANGRRLNVPFYISSGEVFDDVSDKYLTSVLLPSLVYVSLLLFVGVPGNLMVIHVYLFRWSSSTSRIFILALGSYDFVNCLTSLTTEIFLLSRFLNFDFPVWCKVSRFVTASINSGSTFVLVAIATDRFLRICRIHKDPISIDLARRLVIISIFFAALTSWPTLFLYGTYTVIIPLKPFVYFKGKTCLISDSMIKTEYPLSFVVFLLSSHFMVDIVLIVLYSLVGKAIFHQQAFRKSMKTKSMTKETPKQGTEDKPVASVSNFTVDEVEKSPPPIKDKGNNRISFVFWKKLSLNSRKSNFKKKPPKPDKNLIKELKQSLKSRSSNDPQVAKSGRKIHAGKTTLMLFLVTLLFILSFLPYSILVIVRYTDPDFYTRMGTTGKATYNVVLRSYLLNSVVNPIVYCFISKQFRKHSKEALRSLMCCARQ